MKKHTIIYYDYFDLTQDDTFVCEYCQQRRANDIHHIEPKKMGGLKDKDYIENLIALCRECHEKAHNEKITKTELKWIISKRN